MVSVRQRPLVGKNVTFPFQIAIVCWIDLLGYGSMISKADFNPLHPEASRALKRLRIFHEAVARNSARYFPTLVMNDGAVAYRDLSLRSRSVTHDFLVRAWDLFCEIKRRENDDGHPGPRMVLATGFRMRGRRAGIDATAAHFKSLMDRFKKGSIGFDQALREAASIRQTFDIVPQLQANFAFTKAYVAESSGKGGGLGGSNFFVELAILDTPSLPWIKLGDPVNWTNERLRMKASFAPVFDLPKHKHIRGGPIGIRDGLQIAQQLAENPDVLTALRGAAKP